MALVDLQELADRTGLPLRKLRYVVDHELLPGMKFKISAHEAGRPRHFAQDAALGIALIAMLLDAGLRRTAAKEFVRALLDLPMQDGKGGIFRGYEVLRWMSDRGSEVWVELGDGTHLRMKFDDWESGWLEPSRGARLDKNYRPITSLRVDLAALRDRILAEPERSAP